MSQLKIIKNEDIVFDKEIELSNFSPIHFYKEGNDFHIFFIDFKKYPDLIISEDELNGMGFIEYIEGNLTCYINKQKSSLLANYNEKYVNNGLTIVDENNTVVFNSKDNTDNVFSYNNVDNFLTVYFGNSSKVAFTLDTEMTEREIINEMNSRYTIYRNGISTTNFSPIKFESDISIKGNKIIGEILENIDSMSEDLSKIELKKLRNKAFLSINKKIEGSVER